MKKKIFFVSLLGIFLFAASNCKKEKENDPVELENVLLGSWVELPTFWGGEYSDGICDTIIFKEDYTIGLYYPLTGWKYKLAAIDSLAVTNPSGVEGGFKFTFLAKDTLHIYNFDDRCATAVVKNITFKRL